MSISFRTSTGEAYIDARIGRRLPELPSFYSVVGLEGKNHYSRDFLKDTWEHFPVKIFSLLLLSVV